MVSTYLLINLTRGYYNTQRSDQGKVPIWRLAGRPSFFLMSCSGSIKFLRDAQATAVMTYVSPK